MKIAFITQSYPPMISGASIVVEKLATGMAARGHSILVLAASDKGHAYTTQKDSLKIVRLASVHNPKRAKQNFVLWSQKVINEELECFSPDVIHNHDLLLMGVSGIRAAHKLNTPITMTIHQLPWFITAYLPKLPKLNKAIESGLWKYSRWLDKHCQKMVVPTETIAKIIHKKAGFLPSAITNGVNLQHYSDVDLPANKRSSLIQKYGLDPDRPIILHVGRLDVDKQVEIVIHAAAKAMRKTNAQLLVIGDGVHREALVDLANQLGIQDHSHFPGFVSPLGDLPDLYRLANVFIIASEIETQGLVLLEALASKLPVVAVDATCIPELVKDGQNGFLVPPGDVDVMAGCLTALIKDKYLAEQMGQVGRSIVQEHSSETALNKHEALYQKLLSQYCESPKQVTVFNRYQSFLRQLSWLRFQGKD